MLLLLRKIRQKLLQKNRFTTYVMYAIGEIVLVVAGILIAVRIDSERVEKTRAKQEQIILQQIQADLAATDKQLDEIIHKLNYLESAADSVLKSIKKKETTKMFSASVSLIHRQFFIPFASSGYIQLSGPIGVSLRDGELRQNIVQLYEDDFGQVQQKQQQLNRHLSEQLFTKSNALFEIKQNMEFRIKDFDDDAMDFYDPISIDSIFQDIPFANTVVILKRLYKNQLNQIKGTKENLATVRNLVEDQLLTAKP